MMIRTTPEANRLFLKGSIALAEMEKNGVRIDVAKLDRTIEEVRQDVLQRKEELKTEAVYSEWRKAYGKEMNLESTEQLAKVLFDKMGYPSQGKTKTGRHTTDEGSLLKTGDPFAAKWIEFSQLSKLLNNFLTNLKQEIVGDVVRPFFHLNTVRSMRGSSGNPNFQNWPNRNQKIAKRLRECFIPREGHVLLEADFKGIEVATAASVTEDEVLIEYVCDSSKDMHRDTAMQLFFLPADRVQKKTSRDWSKNRFVFPQFYGSSYHKCAPAIWEALAQSTERIDGKTFLEHLEANGVSGLGSCDMEEIPEGGTFARHVKSVQEDFWKRRFRVYAAWKRKQWKQYQKTGRLLMPTGFVIRGHYTRTQICNYPIQSAAFHCNLFTIIAITNWLRQNGMRTLVIGQIHDCVLFDAYEPEWRDVAAELVRIVSHDLPRAWSWIKVPMTLEFELAPDNWYAKKEVKL